MKKFTCLVVAIILIFAFTGCKAKEEVKLGVGVYKEITKNTPAEKEINGIGEANITAVALILDMKGKIVDFDLDSISPKIEYTSKGETVKGENPKSKKQLGNAYKMSESTYDVNGDGVVKEWYEQADIFANFVKGKTVDEVKKLVAEDGRGDPQLQKAGCTVEITEFVMATENAAAKAETVLAQKGDKLKLNTKALREDSNAKSGVKGFSLIKTEFNAVVTDKSGKEVSSKTEASNVKFEFDQKGALIN